MSAETGDSKSIIHYILKLEKWHLFTLQLLQKLSEDNPNQQVQFCEWVLSEVVSDPDFATGILFSDEVNFYVSG